MHYKNVCMKVSKFYQFLHHKTFKKLLLLNYNILSNVKI